MVRGQAEDLSDLRMVVFEDLLEQEHRALLRRQLLEEDEERERHGFCALQHGVGALDFGCEHGLGQPFADVLLTRGLRRLQAIETEPRDDRRRERFRRPHGRSVRAAVPQPGVLQHVLGV